MLVRGVGLQPQAKPTPNPPQSEDLRYLTGYLFVTFYFSLHIAFTNLRVQTVHVYPERKRGFSVSQEALGASSSIRRWLSHAPIFSLSQQNLFFLEPLQGSSSPETCLPFSFPLGYRLITSLALSLWAPARCFSSGPSGGPAVRGAVFAETATFSKT